MEQITLVNKKKLFIILAIILVLCFSIKYYFEYREYYTISVKDDGSILTVKEVCGMFLIAFKDNAKGNERVKKICTRYVDIKDSSYKGDIKKFCQALLNAFPEVPINFIHEDIKQHVVFKCYLNI